MQCGMSVVVAVLVWCLSTHLVCSYSEQFSTALTVKEDVDDFTEGEETPEAHEAEDPEDLEVFYPTNEWQTLKPGQAVPAGSHVRLNLQTGQREVKRGEAEILKYSTNAQRPELVNKQGALFSTQELKEALKKFKAGDDDSSKKDSGQDDSAPKSSFRSVDELKRDMEELDFLMETDVQIMRKLLTEFNTTSSTVEQKVAALLDLEYFVHQFDNAQNLVSMGGMKLVMDALNDTDTRLQESAAFVLGSAVSSNPSVQVEAVEGGALQKLLTMLGTPHSMSVKKKVLFALACLLHHFPLAQNHFVRLGGVQVLGELFQTQGADALQVRIITMLHDLITEEELIVQIHTDAKPNSEQDYLEKDSVTSLLPLLAEQGWCSLVPELLSSTDHDRREKALRTLLVMLPHCQTRYQQDPRLTLNLHTLQKEYQKLALSEKTLGELDGYFGEILALLNSLVLKML